MRWQHPRRSSSHALLRSENRVTTPNNYGRATTRSECYGSVTSIQPRYVYFTLSTSVTGGGVGKALQHLVVFGDALVGCHVGRLDAVPISGVPAIGDATPYAKTARVVILTRGRAGMDGPPVEVLMATLSAPLNLCGFAHSSSTEIVTPQERKLEVSLICSSTPYPICVLTSRSPKSRLPGVFLMVNGYPIGDERGRSTFCLFNEYCLYS